MDSKWVEQFIRSDGKTCSIIILATIVHGHLYFLPGLKLHHNLPESIYSATASTTTTETTTTTTCQVP